MQHISELGFCWLTNIEGYNDENLNNAIKAYHDLPNDVKMKMATIKYKNVDSTNNSMF